MRCSHVQVVFLLGLLLFTALTVSTPDVVAQSAAATVQSPPANASLQGLSLPAPVKTGRLGSKAPQALAEIAALVQAGSLSTLKDLEATGTITFPTATDAYPVSLIVSGSGYTRLDITMTSGVRSLRLRGPSGQFQSETGARGVLPPSTSMAGVLALPRLWAEGATNAQISIFEAGSSTVSGQSLHRITVEYPLQSGDPASSTPSVATDLYFDPITHLLLYSVDSVLFEEGHNQAFTRITSYGSYQKISGILLPTSIQQSIDGQLQWTMQIASVTLNTNPPVSTFAF